MTTSIDTLPKNTAVVEVDEWLDTNGDTAQELGGALQIWQN